MPYVLHSPALMFAVKSVEARMAAVLPEVLEDTEFGHDDLRTKGSLESVLAAVDCLAHKDGEDYKTCIERIQQNDISREVSLADLDDSMNMRRVPFQNSRTPTWPAGKVSQHTARFGR